MVVGNNQKLGKHNKLQFGGCGGGGFWGGSRGGGFRGRGGARGGFRGRQTL